MILEERRYLLYVALGIGVCILILFFLYRKKSAKHAKKIAIVSKGDEVPDVKKITDKYGVGVSEVIPLIADYTPTNWPTITEAFRKLLSMYDGVILYKPNPMLVSLLRYTGIPESKSVMISSQPGKAMDLLQAKSPMNGLIRHENNTMTLIVSENIPMPEKISRIIMVDVFPGMNYSDFKSLNRENIAGIILNGDIPRNEKIFEFLNAVQKMGTILVNCNTHQSIPSPVTKSPLSPEDAFVKATMLLPQVKPEDIYKHLMS